MISILGSSTDDGSLLGEKLLPDDSWLMNQGLFCRELRDLFRRTTVENPDQRLTIEKVLEHEVFRKYSTELEGERVDPNRRMKKDIPQFRVINLKSKFTSVNLNTQMIRTNSLSGINSIANQLPQNPTQVMAERMRQKYTGLDREKDKPLLVVLSTHNNSLRNEANPHIRTDTKHNEHDVFRCKERYNHEMTICRYIIDASHKMFELSKDPGFCGDQDCRKTVLECAILLAKKALLCCKRNIETLQSHVQVFGFEEFKQLVSSGEEWISKIKYHLEGIYSEIGKILKSVIEKVKKIQKQNPVHQEVLKVSDNFGLIKNIDLLLKPRVSKLLNRLRDLRKEQLAELRIDEGYLSFLEVDCSIFTLYTSYHLFHYHRHDLQGKPQSQWNIEYIFGQLKEDKTHTEYPQESVPVPVAAPVSVEQVVLKESELSKRVLNENQQQLSRDTQLSTGARPSVAQPEVRPVNDILAQSTRSSGFSWWCCGSRK